MATIFAACTPRSDVLSGATRDEQFMADLSQVVNGTALPDYLDPALFFRNTFPTRGLRELMKAVCLRLSGKGGEVSPVIRLGTQYGGGKTHGLIAITHAARGMTGVSNVGDFVDPALLPAIPVRIAALDGENTDPANGRQLEPGLRAFSIWGEMAYQLGGSAGYERVRNSDEKHIAPGAEVLRELFGNQPTLLMLDEVSVYLRKVERAFPDASRQFTAFVHALFKAVASTPQVALVYTLAVGKENKAQDAYKEENERAAAALAEAESVAVRSSTALNPTAEDETADVLRVRLFDNVDCSAAGAVIDAYSRLWANNREGLPAEATAPELKEQFARTYPLHPKLLEMLTEKTASLSTFQRTRGMLRLLARTVHLLWRNQPNDAYSIHIHHMDPGFEAIRTEVNEKIGQKQYANAIKADVAAVPGNEPALAQRIDAEKFPGLTPATSYVARTIFWHTLAYGDAARGVSPEQLRLAVCSPALEPAFIEQAKAAFLAEALFLDDRPGAPLRFIAEPNLNQVIGRYMRDVDSGDLRAFLRDRIDKLFNLPRGEFNAILFPSGPWEVPDDLTDSRPLLVVLNYESTAIPSDLRQPPPEVEDLFQFKGAERNHRDLKNNLVFSVAAGNGIANMQTLARRKLALEQLRKPSNQQDLADYQVQEVNRQFHELDLKISQAILQCYRHLLYPSASPMTGTALPLGHTIVELTNPDSPGNGQMHIERVLIEARKLLTKADNPDSPTFVAKETGLSGRGEMTLQQVRVEYRKAPRLSILLHDTPLLACIRAGIEQQRFIYREGNQVFGPGDPTAAIQISDNTFLHTMADAKAKKLWPRAEPLRISFLPDPSTIAKGGAAEIAVTVTGGVPP
ncbi:MAG: ATP-binding protein, partial [Acidobacteriaceae bacterium]|nr:ATP-binding protein [Acidobacteriaceae bacterium]